MTLPPPLPIQKKLDHFSVWQLVLAVTGFILSLFSMLGIAALLAVSKAGGSGNNVPSINTQQMSFLFWILGLLALLAVPSFYYAIRRIRGHYSAELFIDKKQLFFAAIALALWAGLLFAGQNAAQWKLPSALIAPLDILVIVIPILILLTLGVYRLKFGGNQRAWGLVNITVFASTQIILFLEFLVVALAIGLAFLWLYKQPQFAPFFTGLLSQGNVTEQSLTAFLSQLTPLLSDPGLYLIILLIFCLFIPLIEELFKPLGVWFLAGKQPTPAQGFTAGLFCGAAFGMFESFSMISITSGSAWLYTAVARIGTGLLHTLTAGISGWALATTWRDRKYLRMTLVYTGVVLLHGCWNLFALLLGLSGMAVPINSAFLSGLMSASPWVLCSLAALMAAVLLMMNLWLHKNSIPPALPVFSDKLIDSHD